MTLTSTDIATLMHLDTQDEPVTPASALSDLVEKAYGDDDEATLALSNARMAGSFDELHFSLMLTGENIQAAADSIKEQKTICLSVIGADDALIRVEEQAHKIARDIAVSAFVSAGHTTATTDQALKNIEAACESDAEEVEGVTFEFKRNAEYTLRDLHAQIKLGEQRILKLMDAA